MHANGLLGSAKPGHIEPNDQSAVKKTVVVKARGADIKFRLHLINCVC